MQTLIFICNIIIFIIKIEYGTLNNLSDKFVFQLNDTHPALAIVEMMRLLLDVYGQEWDTAWNITTHCCAYTNHTIMSEALGKWPIDLFSRLLPRIYQIVEEINRRFTEEIGKTYLGDDMKLRAMLNVACSGKFASDRTIEEYVTQIWKLDKIQERMYY